MTTPLQAGSFLPRALMAAAGPWCGSVLSLALFDGAHVRWCALASILPTLGLMIAANFATQRRDLQRAFLVLQALVLVSCVGVVVAGRVPLSDEGFINRCLAVLSVVGLVLEGRRLQFGRSG